MRNVRYVDDFKVACSSAMRLWHHAQDGGTGHDFASRTSARDLAAQSFTGEGGWNSVRARELIMRRRACRVDEVEHHCVAGEPVVMDEDYGGDGKSATAVYAPDEISSLDIAHTPLHHAPAIIEHVHLSSECKAPAGLA